nr:neutral zinc metallopeptidase [Streptomonospora sp. PA3]
MAPPAEQRPAPAGADPAHYTSPEFAARPAAVELDLTDHPAYKLPVPDPVDCSLPELDPASGESWNGFNGALGDCLNRLWRPRLKELGLRTAEPDFRVSRNNPDPGGSLEKGMTLAYYEGGPNMTITVVLPNVTLLAANLPAAWQQEVWISLMAHEYGHHVQELAGILAVSYSLEREAETEQERLQTLRRTELQAECLAGVAMRGLANVGDAEIATVNRYLAGGADIDTHGTGGNRRAWFDDGAGRGTLAACNTYAAPKSRVS